MLPLECTGRILVAFDGYRLVANAGLLFPASLAVPLGLGELANKHLDLGDYPGRANAGDKLLTVVASALAGGDCMVNRLCRKLGDDAVNPSYIVTEPRGGYWMAAGDTDELPLGSSGSAATGAGDVP